ncbi:MAG: protein O-mannosyl-transferase [Verrucomicrobiota bacterium]|jgi:Flp pilus assembly protein TadD
MKQRLAVFATLVALVIGAHSPALRAGFVWDDTALVLRDPLIRSWRLIPEGFQHFLFVDATPSNFFRPVQRVTYTLEYWAFGFRPLPYHATNILLHLGAAIALLCFSLALLELYGFAEKSRLTLASVATLVWTLHPLHSPVIDYVSGRADSLAAIFGFAGLYFAIRALAVGPRTGLKFVALAGIAFLAAALSKESGLIFTGLWLALLVLRRRWQALIPAGVAIAFVLTIYTTLRSQSEQLQVPQLNSPAPLLVRPIIAARALAEYTGLLLFPSNLHVDRDVESHPWGFSDASLTTSAWRELQTLAGVALMGLLSIWMFNARRREPLVFALLIFVLISYLPVCGLFVLNATIAEHWIYVPSAFVLAALSTEIAQLTSDHAKRFGAATIVITALWVAFLGLRTFSRAQDWKDPRTFLERTIAAGGDSTRMLINLGGLEMTEGNFERADAVLRRALAKQPQQPFALLNLAAVALKRDDLSGARNFIGQALKSPITEAKAQEMMAVLESKQKGEIDLMRLRLASRTTPSAWSVEHRYLRALDESGRTENAIAELQALLKTEWYRAESWQLLQQYLTKVGRNSEAAEALLFARNYDVHLD